jgi:hypothetical protein
VWATDVRFLNDNREFRVARDVAVERLKTRIGMSSEGDRACLQTFLAIAENNPPLTVFAFSLSAIGDLLSQWRGYCGDSPGFALGFTFAAVTRLAANEGFVVAPCVYDPAEQALIIDTLIDDLLEKHATDRRTGGHSDPARAFYHALMELSPLFKDPGFSEEREWRVVSGLKGCGFTDSRFGWRPSRSGPRPYLALNIRGLEIPDAIWFDEVVISPTPHPDLTREVLITYFPNSGVGHGSIPASVIPYRSW